MLRNVSLGWKLSPGTAGAICMVKAVKTVFDPDASSVGQAGTRNTQRVNGEIATEAANQPQQSPTTSTQATFVTPGAHAMEYDGSLPRGRTMIRARRMFRATAAPPASPNYPEDMEFVDVIATLPGGNDSSADQSGDND